MADRVDAPKLHPSVAAMGSCGLSDVGAAVIKRQLPMVISDSHAAALASWGRTEDLAVSPEGGVLIVAGFDSGRLHFVRFRLGVDAVCVDDVWDVDVVGLVRPHGIAFLDPETVLIANREAALSLVRVGAGRGASLSATVVLDGSADPPVRTPGSVAIRPLGHDLVEVFVCNNYAHDVTRYLLDGRSGWSVCDGERLLAGGLEIPDGVAVSAGGDWIAVSNHNRNAVYLYRYDGALGADSSPTGVLHGMGYPHGLSFADDDRQLVVVDAGRPYIYSFEAQDRDWSGERIPWRTDRVLDDDAFNRGRYNPQEGGMKGLDIAADGLAVMTSEFGPLGFFRLHGHEEDESNDVLHGRTRPAITASVPLRRLAERLRRDRVERERVAVDLREVEHERGRLHIEVENYRSQRDELAGLLRASRHESAHHRDEVARARRRHADAATELDRLIERTATLESHIEAMYASRSWKLSSPVRSVASLSTRIRTIVGR